jgi:hypothetical protein
MSYFQHLDLPELPQKYIDEGLNADYRIINSPRLFWADCSFSETEFFKKVNAKFGNCYVKYYLNPPSSYYDWHVDMNRFCTINWVVKSNPEARTFYREPIQELVSPDKDPIFFHLTELKYQGRKPTLLNATIKHCVANNWPETRIILSMSLFKPTTYEQALEFLQTIKIDEY